MSKQLLLLRPSSISDATIAPLIHAYKENGTLVNQQICSAEFSVKKKEDLRLSPNTDAVLLLHNARRSPRNVVAQPFVERPDGQVIPLGILPCRNVDSVYCFAEGIRHSNRRQQQPELALLAQRHPRYQRLVDRMQQCISPSLATHRWTSSDIVREELVDHLKAGPGLAIYFGHGRPSGWVGYYGLRAHHFGHASGQPVGALVQLCCHTANRKKVGFAFAERLVMGGHVTASFAAVGPTRHTDNTRWAVRLGHALAQVTPAQTIGELLTQACPLQPSAWRDYRIIGDPLARLGLS